MPSQAVTDPESGFLSAPNSFSTFDTPKKLRFLELAKKYRDESGKWPEIGALCDAVGISIRSFYRHVENDAKFKSEWDEILLRGEAKLTSKLADMSNPIGPLSVLRRYFPDRWNPMQQNTVTIDVRQSERLSQTSAQYIDTTATATSTDGPTGQPTPPTTPGHVKP